LNGALGCESAGVDDVAVGVQPVGGGLLVVGDAPTAVGTYGFAARGVTGELPAGRDPLLECRRGGVHDEVVETAGLSKRGEELSAYPGLRTVIGAMTGPPVCRTRPATKAPVSCRRSGRSW
jgi:hypothetical protein